MSSVTFVEPIAKDWLVGVLKNHAVHVKFTKADGTERIMKCTLKDDLILPYETKTDRTRKVSEEVLPVYDLEKESWRSFRLDSIREVSFDLA